MIGSWWDELSQRERLMLGVLGVVLTVFVLFFLVIMPLQTANQNAKNSFDARNEQSVAFQQALNRYQLASAGGFDAGPAPDADTFRADLTPLAGDYELSVSRLQPTGQGGLLVTFEDALPENLFAFLIDVREIPGGQVMSASISSRGESTVSAQIAFRGADQS